jgi:hypothetical protein
MFRKNAAGKKMKRAFHVQRTYKSRGFRDNYAKGRYEYVFELVCSAMFFSKYAKIPEVLFYEIITGIYKCTYIYIYYN